MSKHAIRRATGRNRASNGVNVKGLTQREAARQALKFLDEELRQEREKARLNATCYYPGCKEPPIRSHIISRKLLRRIAGDNQVLTWSSPETSLIEMADAMDAGQPVELFNIIPTLVDIEEVELTDPLFCHPHDESVFRQIDGSNKEVAARSEFIPKQVLLLAFRALCSLSYQLSSHQSPIDTILEFSKKIGYNHSLHKAENYVRLHRFMAKETMLAVYGRYEQMRRSGDYSQLAYSLYVVNVPPCIAATYALIPIADEEKKAIEDGTLLLSLGDAVSFTFLPHKPRTNSICVISWLKGSERAQRFITANKINGLSEKEQLELFFERAFESATVYMSPQWWDSLSGEKRVEYAKIHFTTVNEHDALAQL
jgi:hypothetical protein